MIPLYTCGAYAADALIGPILVDAGWPLDRIGLVQNTLGGLAATAVGLGAGLLIRRLGRRGALLAFGLAQGILVLGLLPLARHHTDPAYGAGVVIAILAANAAANAIVYTTAMDIARPASAATDFALKPA